MWKTPTSSTAAIETTATTPTTSRHLTKTTRRPMKTPASQ